MAPIGSISSNFVHNQLKSITNRRIMDKLRNEACFLKRQCMALCKAFVFPFQRSIAHSSVVFVDLLFVCFVCFIRICYSFVIFRTFLGHHSRDRSCPGPGAHAFVATCKSYIWPFQKALCFFFKKYSIFFTCFCSPNRA